MTDFNLDFQDTATAFADRSDSQLKEKHRLFRMLNSPFLNALGTRAATFALSLGLPVEGLIKRTIFEHFCGGETIEESKSAVSRLAAAGIGSVLDYSVEGKASEAEFDKTRDEIIRAVKYGASDPNIPFSVFKVTGIAPLGTLERMSARKKLDAKSQAKCERIHNRVSEICETAYNAGQPIFIDAEDSWIQDAIDSLAADMMERFNRERPLVYTTVQLYRTDRLEFMKESRRRAQAEGYFYAVKLVRGAYMEKERERAAEKGYPSPIHETKEATDADFDAAQDYCLRHCDDMAVVSGTHNEESARRLAEAMVEKGIPRDHPNIHFSQLYGMGDNISYLLAKHGFNVTKYVPYGPVHDAVPYLVRRAEENSSVAGHVSRELDLIEREMRRRGLK